MQVLVLEPVEIGAVDCLHSHFFVAQMPLLGPKEIAIEETLELGLLVWRSLLIHY
jgi:hypothetical protein